MFFCYMFLSLFFLGFLTDFHVSCCDENCADKPVFSVTRLVVEFGASASASCSVCQSACHNKLFGLEKSVGTEKRNGTTILWTIDKMNKWPSSAMCYYNTGNGSQCCSTLPVLVYQYPQTVNLSLLHHNGPLLEGQQYTLSCAVEKVAPVKNLIVEFLEGPRLLAQYWFKNSVEKKPTDKTFMHNINASKENDGASYWCQTKLDLGPEGPLQHRVVKSGTVFSTVHYKPYLRGPSHSGLITLMVGDSLHLNCSAEGNPSPLYTWTYSSATLSPFTGDVFSVASVSMEHQGQYICSASNSMGTTSVHFNVEVQANYMYIILAVAAAVVALVVLVFITVYVHYYRLNKTGKYNLKDVFRFHQRHVALPDGEL
ncbi:sialic acid-binding Ig-like lectin 7 [Dunckerocampus dactyliophorus]|uniref:sialic acid-binding Ig-like lectin 7 n=1 Tax=Dunckerocampus dactyliophorus TaxID=161453 RepID=UPI0024062F03|nr:sialic acid-binding Ig-like lectin 7 [Dunckerocampus dactyliophorus]